MNLRCKTNAYYLKEKQQKNWTVLNWSAVSPDVNGTKTRDMKSANVERNSVDI